MEETESAKLKAESGNEKLKQEMSSNVLSHNQWIVDAVTI